MVVDNNNINVNITFTKVTKEKYILFMESQQSRRSFHNLLMFR